MNEHDRGNLNFLLKADIPTIRDWARKMDGDDIEYAQELLNAYALELREKSAELLTEARLARMGNEYPDAVVAIKRAFDSK